MRTDKDWEKWGKTDPYFGVLSYEQYRSERINDATRDAFFRTGTAHVDYIIGVIRAHFDPHFQPRSVLDFGSGVGRLVIPFAQRAGRVTGVDISDAMIAEAMQNCRRAGIDNADFVKSDDQLCRVQQQFQLVHSVIVLQHIGWRRGRFIVRRLAQHVENGGYIAVQILSSWTAPFFKRSLVRLRYVLPPFNWLRNLARRRALFEPAMQLHVYDLNKILADLRGLGFTTPVLLCEAEPPDSEFGSTFIFARRTLSD